MVAFTHRIRLVAGLLAVMIVAGCSTSTRRAPYEGFRWERVSGAGLDFMAQRSSQLHVEIDTCMPGAVLVDSMGNRLDTLLRVFPLEHGHITDLMAEFKRQPGWDDSQSCRLMEVDSEWKDRRRYVLVPDGEYADSINSIMLDGPVTSTCSGWGIGNSGMRYFEVFSSCPDKALFVEIGQELPLFDESSIRLTR